MNPILVLGPVFTEHKNPSEPLLADIMRGTYPGISDLNLGIVDVRDVAEGHYRAVLSQGTTGKRYALVGTSLSIVEIITSLKKEFGEHGYEINERA